MPGRSKGQSDAAQTLGSIQRPSNTTSDAAIEPIGDTRYGCKAYMCRDAGVSARFGRLPASLRNYRSGEKR